LSPRGTRGGDARGLSVRHSCHYIVRYVCGLAVPTFRDWGPRACCTQAPAAKCWSFASSTPKQVVPDRTSRMFRCRHGDSSRGRLLDAVRNIYIGCNSRAGLLLPQCGMAASAVESDSKAITILSNENGWSGVCSGISQTSGKMDQASNWKR